VAGVVARRAAFLDRDGTLNVRPPEHQYITAIEDFEWLPEAPEALALLASAGYFLAVVSNQRGVALGVTKEAILRAIEERIQRRLEPLGCRIDVFRYCLHDRDEACSCRKPGPGMLLAIGDEFGIDLSRSWMIGDQNTDVRAGRAAGCKTALIAPRSSSPQADLVASSLLEVSRRLTR
jgi:D-glycero-D-manno-heptose 1,7-bisphosphate phosphatase